MASSLFESIRHVNEHDAEYWSARELPATLGYDKWERSGAEREFIDYHLSRYACYLIAQDGDPRKAEIAQTQAYFAI